LGIVRLVSLFTGMLIGHLLLGLLGIVGAVALHRVVDVLCLQRLASKRDWIDWRREFLFVPLVLIGGALGWLTQIVVRHSGL
jgi:hypothetical protein